MTTTIAAAPASHPTERREAALRALHLFGLCGFAFAQPILDLLGKGATFFVAHGAGRVQIVLFALALVLVPPALLFVVISGITLVSKTAGRWAMAATVGVLVAITLTPPLDRRFTLRTLVFALVFLAIAAGAGFVYERSSTAKSFASYLGAAPVFFLVLFLFVSPVSALVSGSDPEAVAGVGGRDAPVVFLMLDEFPQGALLDANGALDAKRFPGFARLASVSTWYPGATTVAPWTNLAVPALLSGTLPRVVPPVASEYPRSLFTMLGGRGEVRAVESVTRLCPNSLCGSANAPKSNTGGLAKDTTIVALHQILPHNLAAQWLPDITGEWAGFGDSTGAVADAQAPTDAANANAANWRDNTAEDGTRNQAQQFADFLGSVQGPGSSRLWYLHEMLPHMAYRYLPDGRVYATADAKPASMPDLEHMSSDPAGNAVLRQRLLLQLGYVDHQISQLLDRLQSQNMLDKTMLVVTSDHGISFETGGHRRAAPKLDDINRNEVLPVPLFMKFPGQAGGKVDRRDAQIIDVLPTIADSLDVHLPADWKFEGHSLLDKPVPETRKWFNGIGSVKPVTQSVDPNRMADVMHELFGTGGGKHDVYAMGPYRNLVGQAVAGRTGDAVPGGSMQLAHPELFQGRADGTVVPALLDARVSGVADDAWIAIGVNGTVAGLTPVFKAPAGGTRVEAMLDPSLFRPQGNTITAYLVDPGGPRLRPLQVG